jgi:hypothetical protein
MLPVMLSILALSLAFSLTCRAIALRRGLNPIFWSAMGFTFGPLALPCIFLAKRKTPKQKA